MKRALLLLSLSALAAPASPAIAADIAYNFLEIGHFQIEGTSSGPIARVSAGFGDTGFYGSVGYSRQNFDAAGAGDVDVDVGLAGIGYAHTLVEGTDLNFEAGYQRADAAGEQVDGYRGSVGVTHMPNDRFVVTARANHYFGGDTEGTLTTASFGGEVFFNPIWSLAAEAELAEGPDAYLLALHYGF
ncbi:hypothetical protein ACFFGH_04180 [Lysobacter korlensis]|uniref:Outer membrane protein beta-barrel domain-containing protein n=1 Tax=Lysobacter korlensis TaxID=553636 RepID=A0ABV6RKW9_9GAMM